MQGSTLNIINCSVDVDLSNNPTGEKYYLGLIGWMLDSSLNITSTYEYEFKFNCVGGSNVADTGFIGTMNRTKTYFDVAALIFHPIINNSAIINVVGIMPRINNSCSLDLYNATVDFIL